MYRGNNALYLCSFINLPNPFVLLSVLAERSNLLSPLISTLSLNHPDPSLL